MNPVECIERLITEKKLVGAALRVRHKGEVICESVQGCADLERRIPVNADTIYRLASMTKPVTGIAIMQLVEQGKLSLDDPLEKYIPAYRGMLVASGITQPGILSQSNKVDLNELRVEAAKQPITVGMLLSHSSGLGQGPMGELFLKSKLPFVSLEQTVNQLAHLPLDFQPGEGTGYSALAAFDVLGRLVEVVTGKSFDTYLNENIFGPLRIRDVCFLLDEEQQERVARVYTCAEGKDPVAVTYDKSDDLFRIDPIISGYFSGAGGLYGSLNGYERITLMLLGEGSLDGVRILKPETVRKMATPYGNKNLPIPGLCWGLSIAVYDGTGRSRWIGPGSFGWSGGFGTHFYVDPKNDLAVLFMTNQTDMHAVNPIFLEVEEAIYNTYISRFADTGACDKNK